MKLIKAIIRPDQLNEVLKALFQAEVHGLTVSRVQGHDREGDARHRRLPSFRRANGGGPSRSGAHRRGRRRQDLPVERIYRIRTAEEATAAVTPVA